MSGVTVIHTVTTNTINHKDSFWGFGDILRGSIELYNLCKRKGYNFYIDFSLHPISKWLITIPHPYSDIVIANKDRIPFILAPELEDYIHRKKGDGVICLHTNGFLESWNTITNEHRTFMKQHLQPNEELKLLLDTVLQSKAPYHLLHIRVGDAYCVGGCSSLHNFPMIKSKCIPHILDNTILISDSYLFKQYMKKEIPSIHILDTKPTHIGCPSDNEKIRDTLIDFFTACNAQTIYTYSVYSWLSGFISAAHYIYNVSVYR